MWSSTYSYPLSDPLSEGISKDQNYDSRFRHFDVQRSCTSPSWSYRETSDSVKFVNSWIRTDSNPSAPFSSIKSKVRHPIVSDSDPKTKATPPEMQEKTLLGNWTGRESVPSWGEGRLSYPNWETIKDSAFKAIRKPHGGWRSTHIYNLVPYKQTVSSITSSAVKSSTTLRSIQTARKRIYVLYTNALFIIKAYLFLFIIYYDFSKVIIRLETPNSLKPFKIIVYA